MYKLLGIFLVQKIINYTLYYWHKKLGFACIVTASNCHSVKNVYFVPLVQSCLSTAEICPRNTEFELTRWIFTAGRKQAISENIFPLNSPKSGVISRDYLCLSKLFLGYSINTKHYFKILWEPYFVFIYQSSVGLHLYQPIAPKNYQLILLFLYTVIYPYHSLLML